MKVVVLAGGQGERMLPLTKDLPKSMIKLNDKPLLEHILETLVEVKAKEIGVVVRFRKEKIMNYFGTNFRGIPLTYIEQKKHGGTGEAVFLAKNFVNGKSFIVVYGDLIYGTRLYEELMDKKWSGFDCVLSVRKGNPCAYCEVVVEGKKVFDLKEKPMQEEVRSELVNCGVYRFGSKVFEALEAIEANPIRKELELTDAIKLLIRKGKVGFVENKERFFDVGSPDELKKAENELKKN